MKMKKKTTTTTLEIKVIELGDKLDVEQLEKASRTTHTLLTSVTQRIVVPSMQT